ncbi:MAG TPA: hypothetical protein VJG65_02720 [Patescibacteria group bacterium]|nr:hypothetical protein [Patescibacteria group bacterium]
MSAASAKVELSMVDREKIQEIWFSCQSKESALARDASRLLQEGRVLPLTAVAGFRTRQLHWQLFTNKH